MNHFSLFIMLATTTICTLSTAETQWEQNVALQAQLIRRKNNPNEIKKGTDTLQNISNDLNLHDVLLEQEIACIKKAETAEACVQCSRTHESLFGKDPLKEIYANLKERNAFFDKKAYAKEWLNSIIAQDPANAQRVDPKQFESLAIDHLTVIELVCAPGHDLEEAKKILIAEKEIKRQKIQEAFNASLKELEKNVLNAIFADRFGDLLKDSTKETPKEVEKR